MIEQNDRFQFIRLLNTFYEKRIRQIPFLNIDSLLIPSPYIRDRTLDIDYQHSYVWDEEGELLGYLLVYTNPEKDKYHIYKQVTSPFGRGKGIGSAFLEKLATSVAADAHIYLYVWEKLISSIDFFQAKGFSFEELIVYRKMRFQLLSAQAGAVRERAVTAREKDFSVIEELGKVRHDAKKSLKVMLDMATMLAADNFNKVIEDINRESTALLNTLNMYEDKVRVLHEVHVKELITERVIQFIEASNVPCEIRLTLTSRIPPVIGGYMNFSRALINLVSNSLDAIRDSGRRGIIEMSLSECDDNVIFTIRDNGVGIDGERLRVGSDMLPAFVGKTTKQGKTGEGMGTRQIYSTFGAGNISVESRAGEFTRWTISMRKSSHKETTLWTALESKYTRYIKSTERIAIGRGSDRSDVAAFIWQLRGMEIFCYDLVYQFSRHNNVRDIYRTLLVYRYGGKDSDFLKAELKKFRADNELLRSWLLGIVRRIKRNENYVMENLDYEEYKGVLFNSYGQAIERVIIFTMDPESGRFFATDRKLAEHLDFVPYLPGERDRLLRGEFSGDLRNAASPIHLGVWSLSDLDDLHEKLGLIRMGARKLLKMGLKREKRLSFYNTTYNHCDCEIDTFKTTTLGEMADLEDAEMERFIMASDNDLHGLVFAD